MADDMLLLAIDTSGPACSVALVGLDGGAVVASKTEPMDRGHAEVLVPMVEDLLRGSDCAFPQIRRMAVCIGPGSFAGLRVGLSAAKGFALAHGAELVGISAFDLHAKDADEGAWIALDGRRGEVFLQRVGDPASQARVQLSDMADHDFGSLSVSGPFALQAVEAAGLPEGRAVPTPEVGDVEHLAALGCAAAPDTHPASLNYMRGADAAPGAGFSIRRAS